MAENKLTLIDAFNQFWLASEDAGGKALNHTGFTYFYLVKIWNAAGRPPFFSRQNNFICAELGISRPTFDRHRKALLDAGLIDFSSNGSGDPNITYSIPILMKHSNRIDQENKISPQSDTEDAMPDVTQDVIQDVKKENNFTSPDVTEDVKKEHLEAVAVTSGVTSDVTYKQSIQSTEKEFLEVVVSGEKKSFYFFENLFVADAGLKAGYSALGLPPGFFLDALQQWMIRNHGKVYADIQEARKHFLFWLPFYKIQIEKNHATKQHSANWKNIATERKTDLDYAEGL